MKATEEPRKWLTKLREDMKLSRAQLAEASGVTERFISYLEEGAREPRYPVAIRIGRALGLSESETLIKFYSSEKP